MALADLVNQERESPFTDDDRIAHTSKLAERTFGRPVEEIGQVVLQDGRAVLLVNHDGRDRALHWERSPNGSIFWYADGGTQPIALQGGDRAVATLVRALGSAPAPAASSTRRPRS